jgi:integrase
VDVRIYHGVPEIKTSCKTKLKKVAEGFSARLTERLDRCFSDIRTLHPSIDEGKKMIAAAISGTSNEKTIQDASNGYREYIKHKWKNSGKSEYEKAISVAIEHIGNLPIRLIDRQMLEKYRNKLRESGLEPETCNKYLARISPVFNYAIDHKWLLTGNPCSRLQYPISRKDKADKAYMTFDDADLKWILEDVLIKPDDDKYRADRYWLPLIGLFTGARLGDICDLRRQDIIEHENILCLKLGNNKTSDIDRLIPIHSRLLKLGIIAWLENLQPTDKLFNVPLHLKDSTRYDYKWFARSTRSKFPAKSKKCFHSFRSTLITRLKSLYVPMSHISDIVGHIHRDTETMTESVSYAKQLPPNELKIDLEKMQLQFIIWDKVGVNRHAIMTHLWP